tara:strand:+ start:249 stop:434 length:186 start_codon:yes stop_codon:yes gene_type:complete
MIGPRKGKDKEGRSIPVTIRAIVAAMNIKKSLKYGCVFWLRSSYSPIQNIGIEHKDNKHTT